MKFSSNTRFDYNSNPKVDFHNEKMCNDTHRSLTDPDSRLYKKGKGREVKLSYMGHVLMENRHGLVVDTRVNQATGIAKREAALSIAENIPGSNPVTLGADKNYMTPKISLKNCEK